MASVLLKNGAVALLGALLVVSGAGAQSAGFSGTVLDPSDKSIAGAEVKITNEGNGAVRTATTESDGKFVFTQLTPGKYKLEVNATGFKTSVRSHLELLVGITTTLDVRLEVGTVTQVVSVEANVVALNTSDASMGTPISGSELNALPVLDMNPAGLLGLQTGVAYIPTQSDRPSGYGGSTDQDGRSGAVNGARSDQTNVTLDGIDVNDAQKGYAFTSVLRTPQEALAEFRTTTTSYDAESGGRSSGAQVELVTKSGTNSVHGSGYYANRNEAFNANDFFLNRQGIKQPPFRHHLYGASLGGPIIKNRVFLFGNFERLTESLFSSSVRNVPSVAFKDGVFFYPCRNFDAANDLSQFSSNPSCSPPAGGFVQGVSGASYGMDTNSRPCKQGTAGCGPIQSGFYALSPNEVSKIDPQSTDPSWTGPVGPNPAVLAYDQQLPDANDSGSFDQLNILGYRFGAPVSNMFNTAVIRADVHLDRGDKHTIFWRGNLMHDTINDAPQFPGQQPRLTSLNNNKGFSVGYTAVLTNNLVNSFHYGLTRISEKNSGIRNQEFVAQRFIDDLAGFWDSNSEIYNNTNGRILPQNHFRDDVSWTKGVHTFSFGGEFRMTRNATFDNSNSFHRLVVNPSWLPHGAQELEPGQAACSSPGCFTVPLNGGGGTSFRDGLTQMLGPVSLVTAYYNFDKTGATAAEGDPVKRRFAVNEYELYAQDKWRLKPSFTLTLGARYYIGSPPWETNGNQVTPTPSLGDWFNCRQKAMLAGQPTDATCGLIHTDLGGPANHRTGYYDYDFKDVSPRIAFAWSPQFKEGLLHDVFGTGRTSVRAGYSMVYDRIGNGLATSFDQVGSFGLSTSIDSNFGGCGVGHEGGAVPCVRFSGNGDTAPAKAQSLQPSPGGGFPALPPQGLLTVNVGLDNKIKTPYAHTIDLSVGRELPGDMTFEVAYVGRLAHRLTLIRDYAMPADLKDPTSGVSAFQAAKILEAYAAKNANVPGQGLASITPANVGSFWQNIFPAFGPTGFNGGCLQFNTFGITTNADGSPIQPGSCGTTDGLPSGYSATQVAYDYMIGYHGTGATGPGFGTSTFWQDVDYLDFPAYPSCPTGTDLNGDGFLSCPNMFFPSQYVNLNTWTTTGYSFYHALQVILRKRVSHGVSFTLNYTYSHSLDTSSTPERQDVIGGFSGTGGYSGVTINSWNVRQEYANSDFDIRHQFNGYWIAELPFGRGKALGARAPGWLDHVIGGWQLSGIVHLNSGPPVNVINGRAWPTSWDLQGNATCAPLGAYPLGLDVGPCPGTQNVHGAVHGGGGQPTPNLFADPDLAIKFFRFTATGDRGQRNALRADKYFSTDVGLAKSIKLGERVSLLFHWDVFNLTNSAYFDAAGISASPSNPGTFGDYSQMLGRPRQMQGSLKLIF
jgi:Carboxypeptidase regulatory-like domain